MFKKTLILPLCLFAVIFFPACGGENGEAGKEPLAETGKIKVLVTFDAIKEFTEAVGGERAEVAAMVADGIEPHDFEPKARDLAKLGAARIFVYNGLGMERWAEEAVKSAGNDNLIVVDSSSGAEIIASTVEERIKEHGEYDPHLWLSLKGAQTQAENIKNAFVKADPANRDYYESNCADFVSHLNRLYNEYAEKFQSAEKKTFVTGHAAFAYLCRDFGLEQKSVQNVFAEGEPGARQLSELVEYCRENKVTTIFAETMASPEVSETLAREVGAKVAAIYTLESAEDGKTYLERMEENLSKIYDSLSE